MQQVAVRGVDLEDVEARCDGAAHRIAIGAEHRLKVPFAEGARRDPARVDRLIGGRDDAPGLVAAVQIRLGEGSVAVPRPRYARLAPGVRELDARDRALAS